MQDADIIFNLSASNELVGKNRYRKSLILQQSARCNTVYVYASAGVGESTTDLVFSGACIIAENGSLLAESERFSLDSEIIISDIDVNALRHDKLVNTNINSFESGNITEVGCLMEPVILKECTGILILIHLSLQKSMRMRVWQNFLIFRLMDSLKTSPYRYR